MAELDKAAAERVPENLLHGIFAKMHDSGICDQPPADLYAAGMADFYDGFMLDYVIDIPVFEQVLPPAPARVLDLACGSGRISIQLARRGWMVDGLELSTEMLSHGAAAVAQETQEVRARLDLRQGDMTDFDFGEQYDAVILGITSISLLLRPDARRQLFSCVRRHLKPGAPFIFDILDMDEGRWKNFNQMHDYWQISTDKDMDFGIIGQRFYPHERRFILNIYREIADWDGSVARQLGYSEKAMIFRDELLGELGDCGMQVESERMLDDQRFYIVKAV